MDRRNSRRILLGTVLGLAVCVLAVDAPAQVIEINGGERVLVQPVQVQGNIIIRESVHPGDVPAVADSVFVPVERSILLRLSNARLLLEEERYDEAVRLLGSILDGREDYFYQADRGSATHRSLKAEAQRLIGLMPPEGRALYDLQFGARARQMLNEAIAGGDRDALAEVGRQYLHTQAGYESTLLLGLDHLDHARPLAGALTLDRLRKIADAAQFEPTLSFALATCWLQAGYPDEATEVLGALRAQFGNTPIEVAGEPVPWFEDEPRAVAWLAELVGQVDAGRSTLLDSWAMFGGTPARNVVATGSEPLLNARWRVPTADDPLSQVALRRQRDDKVDNGQPAIPALNPLAVGDVVLMRTASNLLAVDFTSGKRLWEVPVDDPLTAYLGHGSSTAQPNNNASAAASALGQRMWDDATYGILSSDGRLVFAVEEPPMPMVGSSAISANVQVRTVIINGRGVQESGQASTNRLAAYDIATGKLKWHLGGAMGPKELPLAGTFFLGAPLPLAGRLYVLGEAKGEIRLFALEAGSGEVAWSQQLAMVEGDIMQEAPRRLAGASPSYADGVLVCPTCTGAVVAVELATRSLLWGFRYDRNTSIRSNAQMIILQASGQYLVSRGQGRPQNSTAILTDGRVLVWPVDSDNMHCLNLLDGEPQWSFRPSNDESIACVHDGNVVLVGRQRIRAVSLTETTQQTVRVAAGRGRAFVINNNDAATEVVEQVLSNPKTAWSNRSVVLPPESIVSGQGFLNGDWYYLPLSSGELAVVDVAEGRLLQVVESRSGSVPGNLICHRDTVLSQGIDGIEAFSELEAVRREIERRLDADASDPVGLALKGELLLEDGNITEAVAVLRRSYDRDSSPRTRELLREGLLEGLRTDFVAFGGRSEEIEPLLDEPWQREAFVRLMAIGLREAGQWDDALEHYLKLIDLDATERRMMPVSKDLAVRMDCWLRPQLAALLREAEGDAASLDRLVEARMQAALATEGTAALERFLDYFGDQPAADQARDELVLRLEDAGRWLEAEMLLWPALEADDPVAVAETVARLATLYRRAHAAEAYAWCVGRLADEFAEVVCADGKTGKEYCDALAAMTENPMVHLAFNEKPQWPVGKVERVKTTLSTSTSTSRRVLPYRDGPGPFFEDIEFQFDTSRTTLVARDALGRERWSLLLRPPGTSRSVSYNTSTAHVRVCGHLVLLSLGQHVIAVDTLGLADDDQPRLLWSQGTDGTGGGLAADTQQVQIAIAGGGFGGGGIMLEDLSRLSSSGGNIEMGPLATGYTCIQRDRDLIAMNPTSGEPLWIRRGLMPGSILFGDDEVVLSATNGGNEAQIYRATDGELLTTRTIPRILRQSYRSSGTVNVSQSFNRNTAIETMGRRMLVTDYENTGSAFVKVYDPVDDRTLWTSPKFTRNVKYEVVGQEAFAIREPNGQFMLFDLEDGHVIAEAKLAAQTERYCMTVQPWDDGYLILDVDKPPQSRDGYNIYVLSGTLVLPFGKGRIYAIDGQGELAWPEPVEIEDQYFVMDQPRGLPMLVFAARVRDTSRGSSNYEVALQCVDKRTGRVVCDEWMEYRSSNVDVTADPEKNTVCVDVSRERVTLTLTDQPLPPPGERLDNDTLPEQLENVTRGLFGVFERAIESPRVVNENTPAQHLIEEARQAKEQQIKEQRMIEEMQQQLEDAQRQAIERQQQLQQQPNRPVPQPMIDPVPQPMPERMMPQTDQAPPQVQQTTEILSIDPVLPMHPGRLVSPPAPMGR